MLNFNIKILSFNLLNIAQVAQLVEQATENRCVGGSIPPLGTTLCMKIISISIFLSIISLLTGCNEEENFFPHQQGLIWNYEIKINSDYTGSTEVKRLTVTNTSSNIMGKGIFFSKIYSNGNMLTFFKDKFNHNLIRTEAMTISKSGYDEPIKKIIYPSIDFKIDKWKTISQLYITKGFQPPLRDFIPSTIFNIYYSIKKRNVTVKVRGGSFTNCIYIEGNAESEFIADTRSGPIPVEIFSQDWICPGVGIVKQIRQEYTKASAFGKRIFSKELIHFKK